MSAWQSFLNMFRSPANIIYQVEPAIFTYVDGQSPTQLYSSQANLRRVIDFRARNTAQIKLHMFSRNSDTDRRRITNDPLIELLNHPNSFMTRYELIDRLVHDYDLYDVAYWLLARDKNTASGWTITPIPPEWVSSTKGGTLFGPETYVLTPPDAVNPVEVPAEDMLVFHGYHPSSLTQGSSKLHALKGIIAEQIAAWEFRQQMWQKGGRIGSYITRPKDAPTWDETSRKRFKEDWKEFQSHGGRAGSTPLFEDGMEMKRVGFNAREEQWSEVAKLSLETIAGIYAVNPVMIGMLDSANFSNTREFRKMLYSETLGPLLQMITDRINSFLAPRISTTANPYVEFNIETKLQGDFEEEASILSTSVGAPWMTVNEARARKNYPALDGGDTLIVPLNVTQGGQASPQDGGKPSPAVEAALKEWRERCQRIYAAKGKDDFPEVRLRNELQTDLQHQVGLDWTVARDLAMAANTGINHHAE